MSVDNNYKEFSVKEAKGGFIFQTFFGDTYVVTSKEELLTKITEYVNDDNSVDDSNVDYNLDTTFDKDFDIDSPF